MQNSNESDLHELERGIRSYAPVVAEHLNVKTSITDYARSLYSFIPHPDHLKRQSILQSYVSNEIARVFGKQYVPQGPLVSNIVDHHTYFNHPILFATNVVGNAHKFFSLESADPIVVFTSAIVPPNNFFSKKGFLLHSKKIPLFSNKTMHQATCCIPLQDLHFVQRLQNIHRWNDFDESEKKFLQRIEDEIASLDFSRSRDYADQVSVTNSFLWQLMFEKNIRHIVPEFFGITQENIVKCAWSHAASPESLIYRVLFDSGIRTKAIDAFEGIAGCWSFGSDKGTHFFWLRTSSNEIVRLVLEDNALVSREENFSISLTPQDIAQAVASGLLIPSLFLIFSYLCFWCGVKPLVGYGSGTYLTAMKNAWLKVLEGSDAIECERINSVFTKALIGGLCVTYARNSQNDIISEYAFDVIYRGGLTKAYLEKLFSMSFDSLLRPAMIDVYQSYVPVSERQKIHLSSADLMGSEFNWI